MKRIFCLFAFVVAVVAFSTTSHAQIFLGKESSKRVPGSEMVRYSNPTGNPDYIKLASGNEVNMEKAESWLRETFNLTSDCNWLLISTEKDDIGDIHYRYQQTWKQMPLKDAVFLLHTRGEKIYSVNGTLYGEIQTTNTISLNEQDALIKALGFVAASSYRWEIPSNEIMLKMTSGNENASYYPKGELIMLANKTSGIFTYTWKFDIYASNPLSRQDVYIDAQTGAVVLTLNKLFTHDVPGSAVTKFSGTKPITTDSTAPGNYRLREIERGNGIQTWDMNQGTNYGSAVDFTDSDNNWNNWNANLDEVAGDAHWGSEMTYDYYWLEHSRNSIDGNGFALISYIHYDAGYANAFWDGLQMTYGDGDGTYEPFTALDICAHEVTHGLTSFTANLDYVDESGALSEGFSDIFGTCVEFYGKPAQANWTCGEDIGVVLRSLSDPNVTQNPDTYLGDFWDPGQEVHQNSTVCSHWFYLLSQGGSGTNDIGNAYSVSSQGLDKAGDIAFRTLTIYLTSTSGYADARFYSLIAASDIFGGCSPEVESTADAWYAVGVGNSYVSNVVTDFSANFTSLCSSPATIQFTNTTSNANTYLWNFGDGTTSTQTNPSHIYTASGNYNVKLVGYGGACGIDSITKTNFISIDAGNSAIASMPMSGTGMQQTCCKGKLYDSGGEGDYQNNITSVITIAPPGAMSITLDFVSFNMESTYDYLYIYDGPTTASPLIGVYDGSALPSGGIITSTTGSITLRQTTDPGVVLSGFELDWQCNMPNAAPVTNFSANTTESCTGVIQFTDLSTNGPINWEWDFGDGTTSSLQHPLHAFSMSGTFNVKLKTGNSFGDDSLTKVSYIIVSLPVSPSVTPATVCDSNSTILTASGAGQLEWYDAPVAGNLMFTGPSFTTPTLYATTTYYVEDQIIGASTFGGLHDSIGAGGYFSNTNEHGLYLNCTQACVLYSVKVYANGAGARTITLVNSSGGTIISGTFTIPSGPSTVILNWNIPVQNGMRLMGPGSPDLFRNGTQGGPNLGYPFNIGGKISIYQSTAGSPNSLSFYYYFYDWELKEPTCISARIPVVATVIECSSIDEIPGITGLTVSPNPSQDLVNIIFSSNKKGALAISVFDLSGRKLATESFDYVSGINNYTCNITNYSNGIYLMKLSTSDGSTVFRIIKQ